MAPSKQCHLAFFLAIALLIAAMPRPSAAVRAEPPSSATGVEPSKWHNLRALPSCFWPFIAPIFRPPTPSAPVPPTPSNPLPKECLPSLMGLMPCKDFFTNKTAPQPPYPGKCCDGIKFLYENAPICICHYDNGDIGKLMSAPIDGGKFLALSIICRSDVNYFGSCHGPVPPMRAAPTPEAAP